MEEKYPVGSRVFAKIRGYCPWPARVEDITGKNKTYRVFFFGAHNFGSCKEVDLKPFEELKDHFKDKKQPKFVMAMYEIENTPNMPVPEPAEATGTPTKKNSSKRGQASKPKKVTTPVTTPGKTAKTKILAKRPVKGKEAMTKRGVKAPAKRRGKRPYNPSQAQWEESAGEVVLGPPKYPDVRFTEDEWNELEEKDKRLQEARRKEQQMRAQHAADELEDENSTDTPENTPTKTSPKQSPVLNRKRAAQSPLTSPAMQSETNNNKEVDTEAHKRAKKEDVETEEKQGRKPNTDQEEDVETEEKQGRKPNTDQEVGLDVTGQDLKNADVNQ